jgi:CII-binding regulator of phage lambda lysogenization HflD
MIKRLQKRLRQIQLLKESGRPLNLEERVNVKTIRCALSAGTVIEVLWAILHGQR